MCDKRVWANYMLAVCVRQQSQEFSEAAPPSSVHKQGWRIDGAL